MQPLQIPLEVAYKEAVAALGEAIVRERLLLQHLADTPPAAAPPAAWSFSQDPPETDGVDA